MLDLLVVVYKIPYSSCIFNRAVVLEPGTMVCAYHTAVYLVHRSCLCHTHGFSQCVDIGSEYFVVYLSCIHIYRYMFGLVVLLYLLRRLVYHMLSKTRRSFGNLHRVISEVLVLDLLVVVYKIPYSSCIRARQDVIGVCPSYYFLSGTTCVPVIVQYITTSLLLLFYLVQRIIAACVVVL